MQLDNVFARKIFNSRKEETIEVIAEAKGKKVIASAPSGKSKGKYEVKDFSSRGIDFSISSINVLGKKIINEKISFDKFEDLEKIEVIFRRYDNTKNLEFIGGNALYALETAILKLMAINHEQELWQFLLQGKGPIVPMPLGNCVGGGAHVKQEKKTDFQEFLFLPRTDKFFEAMFVMQYAYKEMKNLLAKTDLEWQGKLTDENAFASTLDNETVLDLFDSVKEEVKNKLAIDVGIGLDCAASSFWNGVKYYYRNFSKTIKEKSLSKEEQNNYVVELARKHNIVYLEDPLQCEDFNGFANVLRRLPNVFVVGDDLTCTRLDRLEKAIKAKAINSIIIKPNQVGSLIETKKTIDFAKKHDIVTIISHRSGETLDNVLAHFAVGWRIPFIKTGIVGSERLAKLNELARIEREIIS